MELRLPIHAKHYYDGFPLCWGLETEGIFEATFDDAEVTCSDCIAYLKEFNDV
jgi:hypothetical protein